ncbi:MAG: class I SAM-dependent methyltransferase [Baekduia sp.]
MDDHLELNRSNWDERVAAHYASPDYAVERLIAEPDFISGVVAFDRPRLGDIAGMRGIHLQCHIGTDTVSLAKLGARMTGLDFSAPAIDAARRLAGECSHETDFVCAEFHDALEVLEPGAFDLVYTGVGALCWLPRIDAWAEVATRLLKPGGRLFVREGHPMLWTIDERIETTGGLTLPVEFHYFETEGGLRWTEAGTYVETDHDFEHQTTISFNHGLGEIFTALLDRGMTLTQFVEHDSIPWDGIPGQMTRDEHGEWRLNDRPERLPMSYTLTAVKG